MTPPRPAVIFRGVRDVADRILARLSRQGPGAGVRYGVSIALVLVCAAIRLALPAPLHTIPYLLFVPAVFTVSLMFGLGAGLVATALSAVPDGGRLRIETANIAAAGEGAATATPPRSIGDHVSLRVSDTGLGVTAEVKARALPEGAPYRRKRRTRGPGDRLGDV